MRFRKSIAIAKGVKLNLSKTGASLTVGKGPVSVNVGSKGTFFNWSVPGTGVYDRVRIDTLLKGKRGTDEKSKTSVKGRQAEQRKVKGETAKEKKREQPDDETLERLEQEKAFFSMHTYAPNVSPLADAAPLDEVTAEDDVTAWLTDSKAPVPFAVQTQAAADRRAMMIDLDLPEIEDMPSDKLTEMASGELKVKPKTQKEQREDYRTCVFGLGEYVAANVFSIVPQAERVLVSAYTQRRDPRTGDAHDAYIFSVLFERTGFVNHYQCQDPCDFCEAFKSRFYVLASGVMKEIEPYGLEDI